MQYALRSPCFTFFRGMVFLSLGPRCLQLGHTPSTAGTFRKKFRKNSGKTPETLSERFLEFPSRVRLGWPKPYNSRHLRLPERFQNSLPPSTAGDASFFRIGSGESLSELVMEFPAVLGVFLINTNLLDLYQPMSNVAKKRSTEEVGQGQGHPGVHPGFFRAQVMTDWQMSRDFGKDFGEDFFKDFLEVFLSFSLRSCCPTKIHQKTRVKIRTEIRTKKTARKIRTEKCAQKIRTAPQHLELPSS